MEEIVYYNSEGLESDKGSSALGVATSIHSQAQTVAFRQAASYPNGAAITGTKQGDRVFVAAKGKALINVYTWGKESPDQRIPVPEQLTCLTLVPNVSDETSNDVDENIELENQETILPKFRIPFLLIAGSVSGKIYVWELSSGLLLNVKEAHYQPTTVLKTTSDGSYLISAGRDARVLVWKISDLVSFVRDDDKILKPLHIFSDHSLEVSDIFINNNTSQDSKLYTVSKDSTIRVYSLASFQPLTTFVISNPIESLVVDAADRAIFVGLSNGNIRQINLYEPNPATNVLEAKGGYGKVITLAEDHELRNTITYHNPNPVTKLALSLDGTLIVSGDSAGKAIISDIVSKQVVKELKEMGSSITQIQVLNTFTADGEPSNDAKNDKSNRSIPVFKRVLANDSSKDHDVLTQIGETKQDKLFNIDEHLDRVSQEALFFENVTNVNSEVIIRDDNGLKDSKIHDLEGQIEKLKKAYTDIRGMYEELYSEHTKLLEDQ